MFLEPVPKHGDDNSLWQKVFAVAAYLLAWALSTAIGLWLMFKMQAVIVDLMFVARLNPWAVRGFDRLAIYILGLVWFVGLMWSEHYIRTGIEKKRLWHNIRRVATIEAILVAIVLVTGFLMNL